MPKTPRRRLEANARWLEKKLKEDPEWAEKRKEDLRRNARNYLTRKRKDPKWDKEHKAKQRKFKADELRDSERGGRRRELQNAWHKKRWEIDPEYRETKRETSRKKDLNAFLKRLRLSPKEYKKSLEEQNGVCAICNQKETRKIKGRVLRLAIDHSHSSGKFRGLLCSRCNLGLGKFRDNPELLRNAADYLEIRK